MAYTFDLKANIEIEKAWLQIDDTTRSNNAYAITGYIPIVGGAQYKNYLSNNIWGVSASTNYYDIDKNLLIGFNGGQAGREVTVAPVDARFMRASLGTGNYNCTMVQETMTDVYPVDPDAPPVENEVKYEVTQNDIDLFNNKNVILKSNNVQMFVADLIGKGDTLVLTAKSGYEIVAASVEYQMFVSGQFTVASDKQTASLVLPNDTGDISLSYWEINTKATVVVPPPFQGYTFKQSDRTKITNNKGQLFINGVLAVLGDTFISGDVVEIRPIDGFGITETIFISNDGNYNTFDISGVNATDDFLYWDLSWQDDPNADHGQPIQNSQLNGGYFDTIEYESVEPLPPDVTPSKGINDIYLVDDANMRILANSNFEVLTGGDTETPIFTNYSKYILGLIKLPFFVDETLIKEYDKTVRLKDRDFNAKGDLLFSDILRLDLGVIETPPVNNDFTDFDNTIAIIHLPYCDTINIDIDYVIGFKVGVIYEINLYDGKATINITSSKINGVILTKTIDMGITVPFGNFEDIPSNNDPRNVDLGGDNGIKTPYIELLRNDAVLPYGFFTIPIADESLLNVQTGFVKIDEIDLNVNAGRDEKEMILNAISNGVIIK